MCVSIILLKNKKPPITFNKIFVKRPLTLIDKEYVRKQSIKQIFRTNFKQKSIKLYNLKLKSIK